MQTLRRNTMGCLRSGSASKKCFRGDRRVFGESQIRDTHGDMQNCNVPEHSSRNPTVPTLKLRCPVGWFPGSERFPHSSHCFSAYQPGSPVVGSRSRRDLSPTLRFHPEPYRASRRRNVTPYLSVFGWIHDPRAERAPTVATGDSIRRTFDLRPWPSTFYRPPTFNFGRTLADGR